MEKKFSGLTCFIVKLVHYVTSTLSTVMKDEMDKKTTKDGPKWVGDDVVNLLSQNWENAS